MTKSTFNIKNLAAMGILAALAVAADMFLRIPGIGGFLTYEPKDVIITIGAFIFGPIAGLIMSFIVCLVEMVTVSSTGPIGLLMNFLSSGMFVGIASVIYFRKKTMTRAIAGLIAAVFSMTAIMLLWNYIVTPLYMGVSREMVLSMFMPLLIPFNLLKASLNAALVLLLYKGVVTALRKSGLVPVREGSGTGNKRTNTILVVVISAVAVITLLLVMLIFAKII